MRLSVLNSLADAVTTQSTYVSTNLLSGGTVVPVKNIAAIQAGYAQQLGRTGEELSEIVVAYGGGGTAFTTYGTLQFAHNVDTPIYQIHYDQVIFKRSTAGTAGTATALTSGTVSLTPDSTYTEFEDTSGAVTYAYKTQFVNSQTGDLSAESDWFIPSGPSFYALENMRNRTKNKLNSSGFIRSDDDIDDWINEWLEEMNTAAIKVNKDYLLGTVAVSFGTSGLGTITADDYMYPKKIEIAVSGGGYFPSTYVPVNQFSNEDTYVSSSPKHSWVGDTVFQALPKGNAGTALVTYSKGATRLSANTDELPHPMRRYSRSFTYYALSVAQELDGKDQQATNNYTKAQKVKNDFTVEISPRDSTGSQYINLVEELSGSDLDDSYL